MIPIGTMIRYPKRGKEVGSLYLSGSLSKTYPARIIAGRAGPDGLWVCTECRDDVGQEGRSRADGGFMACTWGPRMTLSVLVSPLIPLYEARNIAFFAEEPVRLWPCSTMYNMYEISFKSYTSTEKWCIFFVLLSILHVFAVNQCSQCVSHQRWWFHANFKY